MGIVILITARAQNGFREMFKKYDKLNSVAQENLTAIRVVKAFELEEKEIEKYGKATQEAYDYTVRAEKVIVVLMSCVHFVMYATMIVLLAVGGTDIVHGRIEVSTLTGLLSYSTQILSGVMMFASALNFIAMAKPAVDRIGEILSEENTVVKINEQLCVNTAKANAMTNVLGPISNNFGYIQYIFVAFVAAQALHGAQQPRDYGARTGRNHRARQPRTADRAKGKILRTLHGKIRA